MPLSYFLPHLHKQHQLPDPKYVPPSSEGSTRGLNPKAADCNILAQLQTADVHKQKFVLELMIRHTCETGLCRVRPDISEVF